MPLVELGSNSSNRSYRAIMQDENNDFEEEDIQVGGEDDEEEELQDNADQTAPNPSCQLHNNYLPLMLLMKKLEFIKTVNALKFRINHKYKVLADDEVSKRLEALNLTRSDTNVAFTGSRTLKKNTKLAYIKVFFGYNNV
jgi:hypothetical protein